MALRGTAALALAAGAALLFLLPVAAAKATLVTDDRPNLSNNRFEPAEVVVAPLAVVVVQNNGEDRHTMTPVQAGAWGEVDLASGGNGSFTAPNATGTYRFYCRFHASAAAEPGPGVMVGVLTVREGGAPAAGGNPVPGAWDMLPLAGVAVALLVRGRSRPVQETL